MAAQNKSVDNRRVEQGCESDRERGRQTGDSECWAKNSPQPASFSKSLGLVAGNESPVVANEFCRLGLGASFRQSQHTFIANKLQGFLSAGICAIASQSRTSGKEHGASKLLGTDRV